MIFESLYLNNRLSDVDEVFTKTVSKSLSRKLSNIE